MGSVLISVDERVLQDAMKGTGSEIFVLEQDGRVLSAPNNSMIGSTIRLDQISRIGNRSYSEYKAASVTNEKSGWNIVEFYPLSHYQKTMRDQFWLQVGMVFGVCIVLVSAVLIVIHPVIVSVEAVLKAMHRVEEGDFTTRVEKRGNMPVEVVEIADGFNEMVAQTDLLLGQVRQSALEQKNAEISALEAQIDPHFLYNTLDTINWKRLPERNMKSVKWLGIWEISSVMPSRMQAVSPHWEKRSPG